MSEINKNNPDAVDQRQESGLTEAQQRFCDAYLADPERNGTRVYQQLHPRTKEASARANASRMLANANVAAYIERKEAVLHEKMMARYEANEDKIIHELSAIAFAQLTDFMDWGPDGIRLKDSQTLNQMQQAGIVEIKQNRDSISVKLQKKEALYLLGLRLGLFRRDGGADANMRVYITHDLSAAAGN